MSTSTNPNFLSQTGFQLVIDRIPNVSYFAQDVKLPGISMPEAMNQDSPFGTIPHPGDRIRWEPLSIAFKVDENLVNYTEIYNWIVGLGHPKNFGQTLALAPDAKAKNFVSDAILHVLTSHKNVVKAVTFMRIFPISLSGLQFVSTDADVLYLDATVQFMYSRYEFSL